MFEKEIKIEGLILLEHNNSYYNEFRRLKFIM
jgi:hypothetical protein